MILCTFSWPTQLHLAVPSGAGLFFNRDGRNIHVECQTFSGAKLFSYTGEDYGWLTKEYEIEGRYVRAVTNDDRKIPFLQIHRKKDEVPFTGGTVELVQYTRILVTFEIENTGVLDDDARLSELESWVESVVQYFIDLYRLVTQEGDVTRPRMKDAPIIDIMIADEYEFNAEVVGGEFRLYKLLYAWPDAERAGHLKQVMTPDKIQLLLNLLGSGASPKIFDRLLLDSKEQSFVRDAHDLAIVIAETAFETFLQSRLIAWCAANGRATLSIGRGQGVRDVPYQDAIEGASVSANLDFVEEFSGQRIKGGREYGDWHRDAYKARNAIVHAGTRGATTDNAREAFTAVVTFIKFINRVLT